MKSIELRKQYAKLIADQRALLNSKKAEELTTEDRTAIDKMDSDIDQLHNDIQRVEKLEERERELATKADPIVGDGDTLEVRKQSIEKEAAEYRDAFYSYLHYGSEELTPDQRKILKRGFREDPKDKRTSQTVGTNTAGGYLVPQGFMAELERAQLQFGGVRKVARILKTQAGNAIPWPTSDDTGNTGADSTEAVATSEQAIVFGSKTLNAYKIDSGIVKVSTELFEDSVLNLDEIVGSMVGERLGRRQSVKHTTGAGTTTFEGITIGASLGGTFAGVAAITADELFDVEASVDPAYREDPSCGWMFNDTVRKLIRKLKDSQNRYLFEPNITKGAPDTLLGYPINLNQQMPAPTTGLRSVVFGAMNRMIVRDVRGVVIKRLNELYAESDQVGFIGWYRGDSKVVIANAKTLVYWKQA
jgi:HK97 family phage major capsid protein